MPWLALLVALNVLFDLPFQINRTRRLGKTCARPRGVERIGKTTHFSERSSQGIQQFCVIRVS